MKLFRQVFVVLVIIGISLFAAGVPQGATKDIKGADRDIMIVITTGMNDTQDPKLTLFNEWYHNSPDKKLLTLKQVIREGWNIVYAKDVVHKPRGGDELSKRDELILILQKGN